MRFVWKRVGQLIFVVIAATFLSFLFLSLQEGDAALLKCAPSCTEDTIAQIRAEAGLDRPIPVQYADWFGNALRGEFGKTVRDERPIGEALKQAIPQSLELLLFAQFIALAVAVPLGVAAARKPDGPLDVASTAIGFFFVAVPSFVTALLLIELFAVKLKWFPSLAGTSLFEDPVKHIRELFLPALTLALAEIAVYSRLLRTDLLVTLQEDYIMMARAKGLSPRRIMWRHAFRPSTFSLITVIGLRMGGLLSSAIVVEYIFGLPGMGFLTVSALAGREYKLLAGCVLVISITYVLINFAVDMLYAVLDPRIRHAREFA